VFIFYEVYIYCSMQGVNRIIIVQNLWEDFIKLGFIENNY
jgi:hypothetical protein